MAFSGALGSAGFAPESIATSATVTVEKADDGFAITHVHLDVQASVPGIDEDTFQKVAAGAKAGCPVSKLFNTEITMDAKLK